MTVFTGNRGLLEAFRRGERAALTLVYQQYVDEVAALVRRGFTVDSKARVRGIREHDRQRDLVQEVFLRAFSTTARIAFDGVSPYRPYLLRIAKNLMIDEGRKANRFVSADGADDARSDSEEVEMPSPEDDLEWHRLREATRAYCANLNEKLRRFVQVRFEEEHSQRDAAKALHVTRRKVRTWEREVRDGLRRHLEAMEVRLQPVQEDATMAATERTACDSPSGGRPKERTGS